MGFAERRIVRLIVRPRTDRDASVAIEYALLAGMVGVIAIGVAAYTGSLATPFSSFANHFK